MEETVEMSTKELERIKTLYQVRDKVITQAIAAKKLKISDRQVRNLLNKINIEGDKGIISKKKGKLSNHQLPKNLKVQVLDLVKNYYSDFGPKLANEYLLRDHHIKISTETLRQWMIKAHIWIPRGVFKNIHPPRNRRKFFGELIQVDGSHHAWFENRAASCVLMVFIDDATSTITSMHFAESESLDAYYKTLEKHLKTYGIPHSIYGDRCSVLTPRITGFRNESTQFKKALDELDCKLILASSPEAKGRVERANRTLQDRLVKELRLRGISSIEEANSMVDEYRKRYNQYFSKKPNEQRDAHRSLDGICLEHVLCTRQTRTLTKNSTVQFNNTHYLILPQEEVHLYKKGKVEIRKLMDGRIISLFHGKKVTMKPLAEVESLIMDEKQMQSWEEKRVYKPDVRHPYKHSYYMNEYKKNIMAVGV